MVSAQARLEQVSHAIKRGANQRTACALLKISRSHLYYSRKMPLKDAPVIESMKTLSGIYPRFGSRRIRIFLQRDGIHIGKERYGRLWAKAGLQVPKKRHRKRAGTGDYVHFHPHHKTLFGVTILCMMRALTVRRSNV